MQEITTLCAEAGIASLEEVFGFVPDLFRVQMSLPRIVGAEAGLARTLLLEQRALGSTEKMSIMLAVAAEYRNTYWVTAHHQMLHSRGMAESQLDQIVFDSRRVELSTRDQAVIDFALELATSVPWISERNIGRLREQGFGDEGILEVILVTALSNLLCTLAAALHPSPDFQARPIPRNRNPLSPMKRAHLGGISGPYLRQVELSSDTFRPFAFFLRRFGFIPNIFRAQTLRPDVIEAEADLVRSVLVPQDFLSHFQKECIFLVGSAVNLNTYCVAVHCEMLRAMGVSVSQSDQIAIDHHLADLSKADVALLDFTLKLTARPLEFCRDDIEALRNHGFTDKHILEAGVVVALNNFFNTLQMGLGTIPDIEPRHVFEPAPVRLRVAAESRVPAIQVDPDTELVTRVQNGDLAAFEELVNRHSRRVYRMLVATIGDPEEAQDATQETFLKAFEHIGRFERRSKFCTWLLSIASNNALQRFRERRPLERLDDLNDEGECRPRQVTAWQADPEELYSLAERRRLVENGLMKIPSKYRTVLLLRDLEQLSTEDAAKALGLGISAFKARLFRGRLMLREALSPHFAMTAARMGP